MASPVATRRVGRAVSVPAGNSQLHVFGPFLPGEGVDSLLVALQSQLAVGGSDARVTIALGVSTNPPATAAVFNAQARLLTSSTPPALPVGGAGVYVGGVDPVCAVDSQAGPYNLPVCWLATAEERWFSVVLAADAGSGTLDGSLWIRACGRPDPAPVVPPPPGEVEGDCDGD